MSRDSSWRAGIVLVVAVAWVAVGVAVAAELRPEAAQAYDKYVERVRTAFVARAPADGLSPHFERVRGDGDLVAQAAGEDGIIDVPDGLVHHWAGGTLIGGVTLEQVLEVSMAYDDYHRIYGPIVASQLLDRQDDTFQALFRIREGVAGVTAVLDVRSRIGYVFPREDRAYAVSRAEEIREVVRPGRKDEEHLPAGQDSGYLWRAHTFTMFVERNGGVYVEMETVGLSRKFPHMLGWVIEPIARRLGRKSVEASLREFRDAVRGQVAAS